MVIDRTGAAVENRWSHPEDEAPWPSGPVILPLTRLPQSSRNDTRELGVLLGPDVDLAQVVDWLPGLSLVEVHFPTFRDGRGFTTARTLRERHGFAGEIRASGKILPDQFVALLRVGVTTVALPADTDLTPWRAALRLNGELNTRTQALPWIRRSTLPFQTA